MGGTALLIVRMYNFDKNIEKSEREEMILKRKVIVLRTVLRTMMKDTEEEVGQKDSKVLENTGQRVESLEANS